ncbi:hypothetical protein [Companilactobacillus mishanensis]|uniref:XRE family transcriptional regulator n=1 Tax=Companilactobacillus mishanensis TaxID=2486008 RepID=A0A5P0ZJG3_9LACO|nr:hypothetical protein [Companilactobacillus mishanensis]MQS53229.1 hypothetical protein [Companilactobacillus mishanensis]
MTLKQVVEKAKTDYNFSTSTSALSSLETDKTKIVDGRLIMVLSKMYRVDLEEVQRIILLNLKKEGND